MLSMMLPEVSVALMMIRGNWQGQPVISEVSNLPYSESSLSMSTCEWDAPITCPLPEVLRGAGGRLRQNGDEERLETLASCRI